MIPEELSDVSTLLQCTKMKGSQDRHCHLDSQNRTLPLADTKGQGHHFALLSLARRHLVPPVLQCSTARILVHSLNGNLNPLSKMTGSWTRSFPYCYFPAGMGLAPHMNRRLALGLILSILTNGADLFMPSAATLLPYKRMIAAFRMACSSPLINPAASRLPTTFPEHIGSTRTIWKRKALRCWHLEGPSTMPSISEKELNSNGDPSTQCQSTNLTSWINTLRKCWYKERFWIANPPTEPLSYSSQNPIEVYDCA